MKKRIYSSPTVDIVDVPCEKIMLVSVDNEIVWDETWTGSW